MRTALIYPLLALLLLPWTFYLSQSLPTQQIALHWDVSWVGLDIALIAALLATGILAYRQSRWVVITATFLGSLLLLDAWFDILAQRAGDDFRQAIFLAIFVEIPIAVASFVLAGQALVYDGSKGQHQHPYMKAKRR